MHALVVHAHPTPDTLGDAAAHAWADGARQAGATVDHLALRDLDFDPTLWRKGQPLEADLLSAREAIDAAQHIVFQFPIWWATPPALLKGFIDRTFVPGWAYEHGGGALPEGLLAGRSARLITTMDSPWWWYRWQHGRAAHRMLADATLRYCGIRTIHETTGYAVRTWDATKRAAFLKRAATDGARDANAMAKRPRRARLTAT